MSIRFRWTLILSVLLLSLLVTYGLHFASALHMSQVKALPEAYQFTEEELAFLETFTLKQLPELPRSPGNHVADSVAAAELGHQLFFDVRTSPSHTVSCASCHQPEHYFTDQRPLAIGLAQVQRNTPTIVGSAYSHWQFWDGRKDSLWSQALGPLEDPKEHGSSRVVLAHLIYDAYKIPYETLFGRLPDLSDLSRFPLGAHPNGALEAKTLWNNMTTEDQDQVNRIFTNIGKALEAYQRQLKPGISDYDRFVDAMNNKNYKEALAIYPEQRLMGMRLFMGRANCASCHNGPMFTNFEFHNVGVPEIDTSNVDLGRYKGVQQLAEDPFNCLSTYSDAENSECLEIRFLKTTGKELVAAFKAPSLRNVAMTSPYMHSGQFDNLLEVIEHYNKPKPPFFDPQQQPNRPHFDIMALRLSDAQKGQLIAFLESLTGEIDAEPKWLNPPLKGKFSQTH